MRVLLPLYGSLGIQSYGLSIVLGILICLFLMNVDTLRVQTLSFDELCKVLFVATGSSIVGGKVLFIARSTGYGLSGFSLMGSIVGFFFCVPLYLKLSNIPVVPVLDLYALYAPLLQAISRIGCFLSGCCYGSPSQVIWAVTYTDHLSFAPLNMCLHPAQLYSAISLTMIFFMGRRRVKRTYRSGEPLLFYLGAIGLERCLLDCFRGERDYFSFISYVSVHQCIALLLFVGAIVAYVATNIKRSNA